MPATIDSGDAIAAIRRRERHAGQVDPFDAVERRRAAARRLLSWPDTAVVQDTAVILVSQASVESIALLCEVLTQQEEAEDYAGQEWILSELHTAENSGADVRSLLIEVRLLGSEESRGGADIALGWLKPPP